jgi:2-keto-4-pentenoate hydratase/2-oxohepta-3-ene-1,7-dioic acid hydratase in catechol pathway
MQFLPPVAAPEVICVGLNYKDHADEVKLAPPALPVVFGKASTSLVGHLGTARGSLGKGQNISRTLGFDHCTFLTSGNNRIDWNTLIFLSHPKFEYVESRQ